MLSEQRLRANRVNAQKSTGPRSISGLAASSKNAIRHGFSGAATVVLYNLENPDEYECLRNAILTDLNARGAVEVLLAERISELFWKLRRVTRFETETLSQEYSSSPTVVAQLQDRQRADATRERYVLALGELFRPNGDEIDGETLATIFSAFTEFLIDDCERRAFCDGHDDALTAFLGGLGPRSWYGIGAIRTFVNSADDRLRRAGGAKRFLSRDGHNLTAQAYMYWERCRQQWHRQSTEADRGRAEARSRSLLLDAARSEIVDRYEPRLRRDLSRTLKELHELQARRMETAGRQHHVPDSMFVTEFSQNEPNAWGGPSRDAARHRNPNAGPTL